MVYHTSGNVRLLRNIINDYGYTTEISPHEYMQSYIEKCPESIEDSKLSWIAETFLSYWKHQEFLKDTVTSISEELSIEEQEYFMIIFHALIFRVEPRDMQSLYKCMFNLCKPLLNRFTKCLSNNELLTFISQVAHSYYDTNFVTDKIIRPLFEWQPYISEMAHGYAAYLQKNESRRRKLPTIPVQMNVLNRKVAPVTPVASQNTFSSTTVSSSLGNKKKRMLTKSTIDQKLKILHEKNKQKATNLLDNVKNKNYHYAQTTKSERYYKNLSSIKYENETSLLKISPNQKPDLFLKHTPHMPVKETAATVKRLLKRIQMEEDEEVQWLKNVICYRNTAKIEEIAEQDRQERERERLLDIKKKHLLGLITYEEAVLAKQNLITENKKKYEMFIKEKQSWNEKIEKWRKMEIERNRKLIEKQTLAEYNVLQVKNDLSLRKKEMVEMLKKDSELRLAKALQEKQEELERRIKMIKEFKILEIIAKKAKVPRVIDLTDNANLGFLCEMSIAELQERLSSMKMELKDELDRKKQQISEEKEAAKQELEQTKKTIKNYIEERAEIRKHNKKLSTSVTEITNETKDISDLKKILQEKRGMRMKLNNPIMP